MKEKTAKKLDSSFLYRAKGLLSEIELYANEKFRVDMPEIRKQLKEIEEYAFKVGEEEKKIVEKLEFIIISLYEHNIFDDGLTPYDRIDNLWKLL